VKLIEKLGLPKRKQERNSEVEWRKTHDVNFFTASTRSALSLQRISRLPRQLAVDLDDLSAACASAEAATNVIAPGVLIT
jgi:hypothetical protein